MQIDFDFEMIREYIGNRMEVADIFANTREEVMNCRAMAYGALMFCQREGFCSYEDVKEYWDNYAWNRFEEIAKEKGKGPKVEVI